MIRALIALLITGIAALFIRGVMSMLQREVSEMLKPDQSGAPPAGPNPQAGPAATALKKCPVCGTYAPGERMIGGLYCSAACAAKAAS